MRFMLTFCLLTLSSMVQAEDKFITIASTTSTQNSGLYDYLLPQFTADTGIGVRVVAVGTGQAIKIAKNGDADVLLVHHRPSEDAFVENGYGIERRDVMYNDFVIVGPKGKASFESLENALTTFASTEDYAFVSRGDDSGTHKRERELWATFNLSPQGKWYREIGAGMGAALNMSASIDAYTMSDRGTWLSFGNKGQLGIIIQGDDILFNPYGIILVNPEKHPHVKISMARQFSDWIVSDKAQSIIGAFSVNGMQLFCPNANPEDNINVVCPSSIPRTD
ncbi:sulfate transporter [Amylibacter sp. SFDW26]|uniref:substrate-binding domain-containing protein n=1 Tax=Amylibacter sp. SFDW26 TaxID=2652722 RepID=UPI00126281B8|nr:substrate-binding domain-containing protein [Amylibacter sp. SFDW26]KAB7616224.1 sulfate transporter [Amylibacter sp. SFDW26]